MIAYLKWAQRYIDKEIKENLIWNESRDILKTILIKKKKSAPLKLQVFYRSLKLNTLVFGSIAVQRPQCDLLSVVD